MRAGSLTAVDPDWLCVVYEEGEGFVGLGCGRDERREETACERVAGVCEGGLGYGVVLWEERELDGVTCTGLDIAGVEYQRTITNGYGDGSCLCESGRGSSQDGG